MFNGTVFIAYSHQDSAFVNDLARQLRCARLEVHYDQDLLGGQVWLKKLQEKLLVSSALIVVVSQASAESNHVKSEIKFFLDRKVGKVIPILIDDMPLPIEVNTLQTIMALETRAPLTAQTVSKPRVVPLDRVLATLFDEKLPQQFFDASNDPGFQAYAAELMKRAHRMVFIGMGLNLLQNDLIAQMAIKRASRRECTLEVYLGNPASPSVQARLIEEEQGDTKPSVGAVGIYQRLEMLLSSCQAAGAPESIAIRLFKHYPAFALIIIDAEYFIYPYGYKTLGNFSPVIRFSSVQNPGIVQFLQQQYESVKQDSVDAQQALQLHKGGVPESPRDLSAFALYIIPGAASPLYRLGSKVLGYDVRQQKLLDSPWPEYARTGRPYGFHVTLCDALFFIGEASIRAAQAEVEHMAREFRPFDLTRIRLQPDVPCPGSISLVMDDPSGSLEAMHAEMVFRVYRKAAASNYTLGLAAPDRDTDDQRAQLMMNRYRAPYILGRYRPHFTLLAGIPRDAMDACMAALQAMWQDLHCPASLCVDRLALMTRPGGSDDWCVQREVRLA